MLMDHFAGAVVRSDFLRRFMRFAVALAEMQFLFFKILFRRGLDHATSVEAVGRVVGVPYSIIKGERFVVHGGADLAERRGAEPAAQCPPRPRSDRPPPSSSPAAPTRRLRSRAGKRLMARVHGVMIAFGQAGDALAGPNFPGVKSPSNALDETRQPFHYRPACFL